MDSFFLYLISTKNLQTAELVSADEACDRLSVRIEVLVGGEDD